MPGCFYRCPKIARIVGGGLPGSIRKMIPICCFGGKEPLGKTLQNLEGN